MDSLTWNVCCLKTIHNKERKIKKIEAYTKLINSLKNVIY